MPREPLFPHQPKRREPLYPSKSKVSQAPLVIPRESRPVRPREERMELLPDSPEALTHSIEAIGYRDELDNAFQEAIKRAKGLK